MANKVLGPTFGAELVAAHCNDGVSWDGDFNLFFSDPTNTAYINQVLAVVAAHDSTKLLPITVSRRAARLVLVRHSYLKPLEAAVNAAPDETLVWYEDSATWTENDPHVLALGAALSLTPDVIHALFLEAQIVDAPPVAT